MDSLHLLHFLAVRWRRVGIRRAQMEVPEFVSREITADVIETLQNNIKGHQHNIKGHKTFRVKT